MPKLYMLTENNNFMMSFVFITDCDNAIIVDGGEPINMELLHKVVGERRILAWILTHPHLDLFQVLLRKFKKLRFIAVLRRFIITFLRKNLPWLSLRKFCRT